MVAARRGGVINLASTAAFRPLAGATVYAASKAFVLFFSEGQPVKEAVGTRAMIWYGGDLWPSMSNCFQARL